MYRLRKEVFEHTQTLSLRFFDKQPIGDLMSRVTNDLDSVGQLFDKGLSPAVNAAFTLVITTVLMFVVSWQLSIAVVLIAPVILLMMQFTSKHSAPAFATLQERTGALNGAAEELITGDRTVKAYRVEEDSHRQARAAQRRGPRGRHPRQLRGPHRHAALGDALEPRRRARGARRRLALAARDRRRRHRGVVLHLRPHVRPAAQPVRPGPEHGPPGRRRRDHGSSRSSTSSPRSSTAATPTTSPTSAATCDLDHVDFSYVDGVPILHDVSLVARPGQKIGLVGPTGAGKSTIINVITRYYDIQGGDIRLDDASIYDVNQDSLRERVGMVLQEPYLFSDTVMANIRYARLEATDEECIEAAKKASAHPFIETLPDGYQTVLAGGGSNLSQGQRQLITIARIVLANRPVLILDEATSSVDTKTERSLQEALTTMMQGRTSFVIAHRLSTIRDSDVIVAIDDGRVVDVGSHDELMAAKGFYHGLYMSQFRGDAKPADAELEEA